MPHSCIGAISFHYHGLVEFIMSDSAFRVVEATAAGTAIYSSAWTPVKKVLRPVALILIASMVVAEMQRSEVSTFAHRMRPCVPIKVTPQQSPEPVKSSPYRNANAHIEAWSAA